MNLPALIGSITTLLYLIILARVLLSWFPNASPQNPIVNFIYFMSEPILSPIRQLMPRTPFFDFTPMAAIILITILQAVLLKILEWL